MEKADCDSSRLDLRQKWRAVASRVVSSGMTCDSFMFGVMANTRSILQADSYKGYAKLYDPDQGGSPRLRDAAFWDHLRHDE